MLSLAMSGYLGMDLPRFLALVRARKWLIAAMVVAATLLALVVSLAQTSRYRADADLLFGQATNANSIISGAGTTDTTDTPERQAATNVALASLDTVAVNVKRQFPGSATVEDLRNAVSIHAQGTSDVVTVTAEWDSPTQAAAIANAFATEIVAFRKEAAQADIQRGIAALQAQIAAQPPTAAATTAELQTRVSTLQALKAAQTGNVRLVERAQPPKSPSSPRPLRNAAIAGILAAIVALFVVVLLARLEDRVSDEDELAELMGAPVLTRVPSVGRARRLTHIWGPDQDPRFLEAFEFLRLNLQLMGHGGSLVIAVTSPAAADGKSTVVAWLARSLALSGDEVVAVDLDLRKPELHAYLNASRQPGAGVLDALLATDPGDNPGDGRPPADGHPGSAPDPETAAVDNGERSGRGRRVYTDDDVTAGLVEVARCAGNTRRAARALKREGRDISESTLRRWKELHAEHYADIRSAHIRGTSVAAHLRLLAGDHHLMPSGLLARGRLRQLFDQLREDSDYVLVDTVPVSTVADASVVAAAADAVILVVDLERVRRRDLASAKKQLANARANVLGIVVNRAAVDFPLYHVPEGSLLLERDPAG
jgi:polysaccharide biosynthesis transport protein